MKKILCLFSALTLVLISSCSSDDSSSNSSEGVLLKKRIQTGSDPEENLTINYTYDGNKLISIIDNTKVLNVYLTYTGDLITKLEYKYANGTIEQSQSYAYNSDGKVVTFIRVEPEDGLGSKEVYTYNADGSVNVKNYSGDEISQTVFDGEGKVTYVNGEISEITSTSGEHHKYTYDTKNNPLKNVLGWDKIAFTDGEAYGILHNLLTDSVDNELWSNSTFIYNENGYPVKEVNTGTDTFGTTEYFY